MVLAALDKSIEQVDKTFEQLPTILVSDRAKPYQFLAKCKGLVHKMIATSYGQTKTIDGYNIQKINALHSDLKNWMRRFNGVATKYLQNYLEAFRISKKLNKFNNIKERLMKIYQFILATNNSFVRYFDIQNRPIF